MPCASIRSALVLINRKKNFFGKTQYLWCLFVLLRDWVRKNEHLFHVSISHFLFDSYIIISVIRTNSKDVHTYKKMREQYNLLSIDRLLTKRQKVQD